MLNGKIIAIGGEIGHDKLHEQQTLVDQYDPATNTWSSLATIPVGKSHDESSTYVTPDGKIISAGGQIANFGITDDVIEYDPASNAWTTIGKLPEPLQGPVVQQIGNQIIVATGNAARGRFIMFGSGIWDKKRLRIFAQLGDTRPLRVAANLVEPLRRLWRFIARDAIARRDCARSIADPLNRDIAG